MDFSEGKIGKGWNNLSVHIKKQINYQMKIRRSIDMGELFWILEKLV